MASQAEVNELNLRNLSIQIAHGSFQSMGKPFTAEELIDFADTVRRYLDPVVKTYTKAEVVTK